MRSIALMACLIAGMTSLGHAQSADEQISLALLALPEAYRDGASVVTWDKEGESKVLRQGANGWTCRAEDPAPGIIISVLLQDRGRSVDSLFRPPCSRRGRAAGKRGTSVTRK